MGARSVFDTSLAASDAGVPWFGVLLLATGGIAASLSPSTASLVAGSRELDSDVGSDMVS